MWRLDKPTIEENRVMIVTTKWKSQCRYKWYLIHCCLNLLILIFPCRYKEDIISRLLRQSCASWRLDCAGFSLNRIMIATLVHQDKLVQLWWRSGVGTWLCRISTVHPLHSSCWVPLCRREPSARSVPTPHCPVLLSVPWDMDNPPSLSAHMAGPCSTLTNTCAHRYKHTHTHSLSIYADVQFPFNFTQISSYLQTSLKLFSHSRIRINKVKCEHFYTKYTSINIEFNYGCTLEQVRTSFKWRYQEYMAQILHTRGIWLRLNSVTNGKSSHTMLFIFSLHFSPNWNEQWWCCSISTWFIKNLSLFENRIIRSVC